MEEKERELQRFVGNVFIFCLVQNLFVDVMPLHLLSRCYTMNCHSQNNRFVNIHRALNNYLEATSTSRARSRPTCISGERELTPHRLYANCKSFLSKSTMLDIAKYKLLATKYYSLMVFVFSLPLSDFMAAFVSEVDVTRI